MKIKQLICRLGFIVFLSTRAWASSVTLTNTTAISPINSAYDGADLVISNCTVTLDGPHSFNSLLVGPGGVLTQTAWPTGNAAPVISVTNELQILDGYNPATLLYSNVVGLVSVTDTNSLVTYSNGVDYIQTNLPDGATQIYATTNSSIPGYAVVYVSYNWTYSYAPGLNVTLTNDLTVAAGGRISADNCGFGPGFGVGAGRSSSAWLVNGTSYFDGSGAGHGGMGGISSSNGLGGSCYGSLYVPVTLGSGGGASYAGPGGSGGGRIQINAGGSVNLYGTISANGMTAVNNRAGGGAGGSVWIVATNFNGTGTVTVNGGAGQSLRGGGGGGGRISIQSVAGGFSGNLAAYGGAGFMMGGAGTVYTVTGSQTGLLVVDNGGRTGTNTTISLPILSDLAIRGGAVAVPNGTFSPNNLTIGTNGILTGIAQSVLNLTVGGNLTIQAGGALWLDSRGYGAGGGPAPGVTYNIAYIYPSGGGGHGGYGANGASSSATGGVTYDSQTAPTTMGSGGGGGGTDFTSLGGAGGGAVQLNVAGTLQVDGRLTANGGNGAGPGGGGGSGGSIYIASCAALAGAGSITANGGSGVAGAGGGGGGGRIAVIGGVNNFTGTMSAYGGGGFGFGGAGTIYTQFGSLSQLLLDNGGNSGSNTLVTSGSATKLVVQNGARAIASGAVNFSSLQVNSNGWLTHLPADSLNLSISGNATIQPGGGFMGDFLGRNAGQGNAAGSSASASSPLYGCSGGGYGGRGGAPFTNTPAGGYYSGDTAASPSPSYSGSGGGTTIVGTVPLGGNGGGFLQLTVSGTLQLDGLVSANGNSGVPPGGGGGAGGGVYLTAGTLAGSGTISVLGGAGIPGVGGGGGGGRIAVYFSNNNFSGTLSAMGGAGANYGGAGTIYLKTNSFQSGQVIVDNAGHVGADTPWTASSSTDLILRNGGSCYLSGSTTFGNLTVASNAWLFSSNGSPSLVSVTASSVTVQAAGAISADLSGSSAPGAGTDSGTSPYYSGGGGSHGGYGAGITNSPGGGSGGMTYDNELSPFQAGGAGGGYSTFSTGGKGGGALSLNVFGTLQVDGTLSANGGNGSGVGGGGGAGGTLNLSCSTLSGAGSIAANGGNGVAPIGGVGGGGGGGGGMIYTAFNANHFTGTTSAYGGSGAAYGGAGTIYVRTNNFNYPILIVDNGGHRGSLTPLATANALVVRNGATAYLMSSGSTVNSLLVTSNAWLVGSASPSGTANLNVIGNVIIQSGGGIVTDGNGSPQNSGTGHGNFANFPGYQGGGAGHGGYGGLGYTNGTSGGGITFDSTTSPSSLGSGGGANTSYSSGGSGGGYVRLSVSGVLQLDGSISANGVNGLNTGGGGSGGSIYLAPGTLSGSGVISANGGFGAGNWGGGGGGGRIAIYIGSSNSFTGAVTAYGGSGFNYGGAGTIYYGAYLTNFPRLILDNNNNPGTNTSFDFANMDVTVQNRAVGLLPGSTGWMARNIFVRTNGVLVAPPFSTLSSVNLTSLTIDTGGVVTADQDGFGAGAGPGYGYPGSSLRGGGGFGGFGGGNIPGYGQAYNSILSPNSGGSGGASFISGPPYSYGGNGGGALQLFVSNILLVNGRLSANGGNGGYNSGGGSGGSLNLSLNNKLLGNGVISANGGSSGGGAAGGGGGGRIALNCISNGFTGTISAAGGAGLSPGGAGTIYSSIAGARTLLVNNGGLAGTNTPLGSAFALPASPFDLTISGNAAAQIVTQLPLLGNLTLAAGSLLNLPSGQSNLVVAVQKNANLAGNIVLDNLGYTQTNGPGAGSSLASKGSGGSYGGNGGASSSGAAVGSTYGSASQPVNLGSGGGSGAPMVNGGSEGGGAVRLSVGGTLNIDGNVTANGDYGWQDDSGGGSGGSVWLSAGTFTGAGNILALGGNGGQTGGGGGGGGRIAIYTPTNSFLGVIGANGGSGYVAGQAGTIFTSALPLNFVVTTLTPTGLVNNVVGALDVTFNEAVDPATVTGAGYTLVTPAGPLAASNLTAAVTGVNTVHVSFPVQNLAGTYTVQVAGLNDILGAPVQPYTNTFTIALPTISGTVTDTNHAPIAGVTLQPNGGLPAVVTDAGGNYSIGVPPAWNGTVTPSLGANAFVPGTQTYTNVTVSLTGQNYVLYSSIAPALTASATGGNLALTWSGITGVTYQAYYSTNLVTWLPYGGPVPGTNGPQQITLPVDSSPSVYFRLGASN